MALKPLPFEVLEEQEDSVLLELQSNEQTRKMFPFEFYFRLRYTLANHGYQVETFIFHRRESAEETMHYAVGAHPGFSLSHPLAEYRLELPEAKLDELEHFVFSPQGLVLESQALPNDIWVEDAECPTLDLGAWDFAAMDLFLNKPGETVNLICKESDMELTLEMEGYPVLGLWQVPEAPYLCLEPWSSHPGREGIVEDLESMPGLEALARGEKKMYRYKVHMAAFVSISSLTCQVSQ